MKNEVSAKVVSLSTNDKLIAHAMGGIDGLSYTNSLEAFTRNYNAGYRVFEVDLIFTSDDKLVAKHDWSVAGRNAPLTYAEFMNSKINGRYTPLSFEDVVLLLHKFKDIYIITDTKETDRTNVEKAFRAIYNASAKIDSSVLDRVIPQIYNQGMYDWIKAVYNFKDIIYTLYQSSDSDEQVLDFVSANNISKITMSTSRFNEDFTAKLAKLNVITYVHTVNSTDDTELYIGQGAYGFYSDFIIPSDDKQAKAHANSMSYRGLARCLLAPIYGSRGVG